jgi:hypothetical protein
VLRVKGRTAATINHTPEQAEAAAQALAKGLYGEIFDWLVDRINTAVASGGSGCNYGSDSDSLSDASPQTPQGRTVSAPQDAPGWDGDADEATHYEEADDESKVCFDLSCTLLLHTPAAHSCCTLLLHLPLRCTRLCCTPRLHTLPSRIVSSRHPLPACTCILDMRPRYSPPSSHQVEGDGDAAEMEKARRRVRKAQKIESRRKKWKRKQSNMTTLQVRERSQRCQL